MIITNVQYYRWLNFSEYLKVQGISYSSIKGFDGPPTAGMSLGTKVHQYLLEPTEYTWEDVSIVREIAAAIRPVLGSALAVLEKEVAFTADFQYNGMVMPYKGKADLLRIGKIVVDLKVLAGPLIPSIDRFGYAEQISGYCLATRSSTGLIVAYNKARKRVETKIIKPDESFWQYQVAHRGMPINN